MHIMHETRILETKMLVCTLGGEGEGEGVWKSVLFVHSWKYWHFWMAPLHYTYTFTTFYIHIILHIYLCHLLYSNYTTPIPLPLSTFLLSYTYTLATCYIPIILHLYPCHLLYSYYTTPLSLPLATFLLYYTYILATCYIPIILHLYPCHLPHFHHTLPDSYYTHLYPCHILDSHTICYHNSDRNFWNNDKVTQHAIVQFTWLNIQSVKCFMPHLPALLQTIGGFIILYMLMPPSKILINMEAPNIRDKFNSIKSLFKVDTFGNVTNNISFKIEYHPVGDTLSQPLLSYGKWCTKFKIGSFIY